ncbi:MAG: glycosyl hydrolase 115 family protein [Treponema sp.]|nr:glycosyl hydrolase 115 family protein [Treponema sp.]
MNEYICLNDQNAAFFTVEKEAFEGVKRIAKKIAIDFKKIFGILPEISEEQKNCEYSIIFATIGKSPLVNKLIKEGKYNISSIEGKREVYQIKLLDNVFEGISKTLLICGSDKRGTIYGMFALSEFIGVSPLHFWGDVDPIRKKEIKITKEIETVSNEPSVKYRGFFINDEWPCFGNWTTSRFNGFTAQMYDHVFELLLRLKGNYLWPAMWTSSFALDGPGNLNEELADIYGVVIGASHHEPCLRASEEWDIVRGKDSIYGNDWNYYKNKNGLLKYWEDGLKRSGKYEKIITLGMRGERDSSMISSDGAALKENISLLKDIIVNQRELIKKYINPNIDEVPQLLALYKEVEEYYYGNEYAEGLKNWDELNGVICMLCEDNFGFMRTLPTADLLNSKTERKSGFGMYYHFDYHGEPVSYEWLTSTPFEKTWEQMCMAYEYGIKDVWIVNVGDLKFNEVPLAYFLKLAYDFDKWGTNSPNKTEEYTLKWLKKTFPSAEKTIHEKMAQVLTGYIKLNSLRRPEAQNADVYHPCHYNETDRILEKAELIEKINEEIYSILQDNEKDAYYSLIYYPAKASINLLRMNLYAGKNKHYAKQGKKIANKYSDFVKECIEKDRELSQTFAKFNNGKWKGMELAPHIGFVKWNEDNCRYPLMIQVEPAYKPRMTVSRKDREDVYTKTYGSPMKIIIEDFLYIENDEVVLEIANDGIDIIEYIIETKEKYDWLEISSLKGTIEYQEEIVIRCNKNNLNEDIQSAILFIKEKETTVEVEIKARKINTKNIPPMTFFQNNGIIVMEANHFCAKKDANGAGFIELKNYGRSGCGLKVFPVTASFKEIQEKPILTYRFLIEEEGNYTAEFWTTPTNPVQYNSPLRFLLTTPTEENVITVVPADFKSGNPSDKRWCKGVLDNIRISKTKLNFKKGINEIYVGAMEAGLILERILIYKSENLPLKSYLGPQESFFTKE